MRGLIARMAGNGVAANLLMLFFLFTGIVSALNLTQKVFPEYSLNRIQVTVEYRGATPEEVEQSVVQPIEQQVQAVEGIREITATAAEGLGIVTVELQEGQDVNQRLQEIKSEVDRIANLPARAEQPEVREITNRRRAIELAVYGDAPERTLKELAYRMEEELAQEEAISFVEVAGVRDYEISIEVPKDVLRAYGLSLPDVAAIVGANSLDLPAGDIKSTDSQILVRTLGEAQNRQDYQDILLVATEEGAAIRLGDVAVIRDDFRDSGIITRYNGQPAAIVEVFRTGEEQVLEIADAVDQYLDRFRKSLPHGISVDVWQSEAEQLRSRLTLLVNNALIGAVLVVLTLALFLRLRVAFWVGFGIVVSFVGTFAVMNLLGVSINQMSLFGFILAIGIVVDDAIVVGENINAEMEGGRQGVEASVAGTQRVAVPVLFAVATTMLAFAPLLFLPGTIGKFLSDIPIVVISVLGLSLIESLAILPYHLSHMRAGGEPRTRVMRAVARGKGWFDRQLKRFVNGPLDRSVGFATAHYGVVLAGAVALMLLTAGLFMGGYVRFVFFPDIEGDIVTARYEMPVGTAEDVTLEVAQALERGAIQAADALVNEQGEEAAGGAGENAEPGAVPGPAGILIKAIHIRIGQLPQEAGPASGGEQPTQPNAGSVRIKLSNPDTREIGAKAFEDAWRRAMGPLPLADYVSFSGALVDAGSPVSVELSHPDSGTLDTIVDEVTRAVERINGVTDVYDTREQGQRELEVRLLEQARSFGVSLESLANQVRAAFFGAEALRIQRGREEVRVYVRLPEQERNSVADLDTYRIRPDAAGPAGGTEEGGQIPLSEVAEVSFGTGPSSIERRNVRRIVTVNGDVQPGIITGQEATTQLRQEVMPELQRRYPEMTYEFGGAQREQGRTLPALFGNFAIALFAIYALLAVSFRSYTQPLIILSIVPFGLIGAVLGHLALGLDVTFLSLFGIVGLSGVVINDALILIDFANARRMGDGTGMRQAIIDAAKSRFRPILLTSVTTCLGVAPIILSQSTQAQFLIPLAASIAFGVLFATPLQMLLVPALTMLQFDGAHWMAKRFLGRDVEVVRGSPGSGSSKKRSSTKQEPAGRQGRRGAR